MAIDIKGRVVEALRRGPVDRDRWPEFSNNPSGLRANVSRLRGEGFIIKMVADQYVLLQDVPGWKAKKPSVLDTFAELLEADVPQEIIVYEMGWLHNAQYNATLQRLRDKLGWQAC